MNCLDSLSRRLTHRPAVLRGQAGGEEGAEDVDLLALLHWDLGLQVPAGKNKRAGCGNQEGVSALCIQLNCGEWAGAVQIRSVSYAQWLKRQRPM